MPVIETLGEIAAAASGRRPP
ncbi:hypothetical protein [Nonomuraea coxensis]